MQPQSVQPGPWALREHPHSHRLLARALRESKFRQTTIVGPPSACRQIAAYLPTVSIPWITRHKRIRLHFSLLKGNTSQPGLFYTSPVGHACPSCAAYARLPRGVEHEANSRLRAGQTGVLMPDLEQYRLLIRESMDQLTELLVGGADIDEQLGAITTATVALIRGAEYADVMLIDGELFESVAPTKNFVTELDAVQMRHGRGPCLEAAVDGAIIRASDLANETRWPEFCTSAVEAGIRSALTYPLHAPRHQAAALNVYGCAAGTFNVEDEAIGAIMASLASHMLAVDHTAAPSTRTDQIHREVVARATGILMERFHTDERRAQELLDGHADSTEISAQSAQSLADGITREP